MKPIFWNKKCRAIPLQALTGPECSRRLRLPDFKTIGTWRRQGCQPYVPAVFTPRKYFWYSFLLGGWVDPRAVVRPEVLYQWKIPVTSSGIDPATFRFVAQCLNHLCHRVPLTFWNIWTELDEKGENISLQHFITYFITTPSVLLIPICYTQVLHKIPSNIIQPF
jgi:hypothetical protein